MVIGGGNLTRIFLLFLGLSISLGGAFVFAQSTVGGKQDSGVFKIRLLVEPIVGSSNSSILKGVDRAILLTVASWHEGKLFLTHLSADYSSVTPVYEIEGSQSFALYLGHLDSLSLSAQSSKPMAWVTVHRSAEMTLIHMVPRSLEDFSCNSYDITDSRFEAGMGHVINFSEWEIAANVADTRIQIMPGQSIEADISGIKRYQLPLKFLIRKGNEWEWVYNSRKSTDPLSRLLILLYQKPGRGQFSVRVLNLDRL